FMKPLRGLALPSGGTIGVVAPASSYNIYSDVLRGIAWWEAKGYRVKLAENALQRTNWTAGSPEQRASDLMAMFTDPGVDVIQCLRGGCGSAEIIPLLDFQIIAEHPKPFIGFSDITALHCALLHLGMATFYGPSLTIFDPSVSETDFTARHMLKMLGGETTGDFPRSPDDPFVRALAPGKASGRLVGGCLSDLMHTMGTPWEINLDDAIFVFEEVGTSPHHIDRMLLQMSQAGKLKPVRGVVVGDLTDCEWSDGGGAPWPHTKTLEEVLEDRLKPLGIPVVSSFPFGHGPHKATLPLGVQATLDAETCTLTITEPALRLPQ
ncbi:MAG TPA: LD-carboxypeptidase, partial [Ktedonobacteraceae bacterium]